MNTKTTDLDKLVKVLRSEKLPETKEELSELAMIIKIMSDEIEVLDAKIKASLKEKMGMGEIILNKDLGKKAILKEGKATSEFNPRQIFKEMTDLGYEDSFFDIVKVVAGRVNNLKLNEGVKSSITEIINFSAIKTPGKPSLSIAKLSKADLKSL